MFAFLSVGQGFCEKVDKFLFKYYSSVLSAAPTFTLGCTADGMVGVALAHPPKHAPSPRTAHSFPASENVVRRPHRSDSDQSYYRHS